MKVTIITPTFNSEDTINDTIESINIQTYEEIEHIIIDGASKDKTIAVINEMHKRSPLIISEPDDGLYDAINKGLKLASGDIIGILNSDDALTDKETISEIVKLFKNGEQIVFGDVRIVKRFTRMNYRYYSSQNFNFSKFKFGLMPAHPAIYILSNVANKIGLYNKKYDTAADFEYCIRLFSRDEFRFKYIKKCIVTMSAGGVSDSGIFSKWKVSLALINACRDNGIKTNIFLVSIRFIIKLRSFTRWPA